MQEFVVETLLFLVGLFVSFGLPWLVSRWLRSGRPSTTPAPIADDGAGGKVIPLKATFSGLHGLSWVGLASNNLNPRLVITPAGITYRVMGLQSRSWADIEQVDVRSFGATVNLGLRSVAALLLLMRTSAASCWRHGHWRCCQVM